MTQTQPPYPPCLTLRVDDDRDAAADMVSEGCPNFDRDAEAE